jgi:hypothetical protein
MDLVFLCRQIKGGWKRFLSGLPMALFLLPLAKGGEEGFYKMSSPDIQTISEFFNSSIKPKIKKRGKKKK